ncbi:hypothetical protein VPH35_071998 [Triticum aestivum]
MPAPNVIDQVLDEAIVGATYGSIYHFVKGVCTSPNGSHLAGGFLSVPMNALYVGRWAAWFGVAQSTKCTVQHASPGCPFENTAALGVAQTLFAMHHGARVALRTGLIAAAMGGVLDMTIYSRKRSACRAGVPATPRCV